MFIITRITLVTFLFFFANGEDNEDVLKEILDGIKPTTTVMNHIYAHAHDDSRGFKEAIRSNDKFLDFGKRFIANLKDFAPSFMLINDQVIERDSTDFVDSTDSSDQSISQQLGEIKDSFIDIERLIANKDFVAKIENESIDKKFKNSIHGKVKQLQKRFVEFVDQPDIDHKQRLNETCNDTNAMNDVLTSLHNEIVNGGNGTLNELLDGGFKRELLFSESWSNVFLSIYIQSNLLRAVCYPLIHQDNGWKDLLDKEMKVQQEKLVEIGETIDHKLKNLEKNRVDNAFRALPMWLDENWDKYGNFQLNKNAYMYLNDKFGYGPIGNFTKFNSAVIGSTDVNDRNPDLFYYSKGDRSVVVGLGKIWPKYSCDQQTDNEVKKLTCFKIGDKVISYHGEQNRWFDSQYWDTWHEKTDEKSFKFNN